jgi:hypothetical protein
MFGANGTEGRIVERAQDYPFPGSQRRSRTELVERCQRGDLE